MEKKVESDAVKARRIEVARVRRERSQQALLSTAFDLLGREYGRIHNVDAIVAQAGVTRATFYNHYGSLEELLTSLSWKISHNFNLKVLEHIGTISYPPEQSTIFIKAYLQKAVTDPRWAWSMVNLSLYGPLLGAASHKMCTANVKRGMKSGDYSCTSASAGRDITLGSLLAAMMTILREGNGKGYVPSVVLGIMLALGVPDDRAQKLSKRRLPLFLDPTI
jgi:hypothetical protein